jgi:hypothetical protein
MPYGAQTKYLWGSALMGGSHHGCLQPEGDRAPGQGQSYPAGSNRVEERGAWVVVLLSNPVPFSRVLGTIPPYSMPTTGFRACERWPPGSLPGPQGAAMATLLQASSKSDLRHSVRTVVTIRCRQGKVRHGGRNGVAMRASMHRWGWTCTGIGSFGRPGHDLQPALLGTRMTNRPRRFDFGYPGGESQ